MHAIILLPVFALEHVPVQMNETLYRYRLKPLLVQIEDSVLAHVPGRVSCILPWSDFCLKMFPTAYRELKMLF